MTLSKNLSRILAVLVAVGVAACDSGTTGVADTDAALEAGTTASVGTNIALIQQFEVCKTYVGAVGPAVTVDWEVDRESTGPGVDLSGSVVLADGECAVVHNYIEDGNTNGGREVQAVTVTEQVPAGYDASYIRTVVTGPVQTVEPEVPGNSASGGMTSNPDNGFSVEFINTEIFVPGDEGCTPGYWRQPHHFDSYPAGFDPTTPFIGGTTGFTYDPALRGPESGNASDLDLLGALTLRGGGVNALIRHAAAAILNANSSGVAYAYSPAEVQDLYNLDNDKDALEAANEAGCPLN